MSRLPLLPTAAITLAAAMVLAGCRGGRAVAEPAPPAPLLPAPAFVVTLNGSVEMNGGNAVVVRVYSLRGTSALQGATLPELWADDGAVLGADLLQREEVRLFPGEERGVSVGLGPEVTALAIVANLRDPAGRAWQHVLPVGELPGSGAAVTIEAHRVVAVGD